MARPDIDAFCEKIDVSRETLERLIQFEELLKKWTVRINLISRVSVDDIWQRHFLDSAQLLEHAPKAVGHWLDLGSGGGLPGVVAAICAQGQEKDTRFTFIESDQRKSVFLETVVRQLNLPAQIIADRVELVPPQRADVISARALAPLPELLALAARHAAARGVFLFHKGQRYQMELTQAAQQWKMTTECIPSLSDRSGVILKIGELRHV